MNTRKELESNRLLRGDLGPFKTEESQWGSSIVLTKYDAQLTFASAEQSLRGMRYKQYRPDLLIADDIEDNDSGRSDDPDTTSDSDKRGKDHRQTMDRLYRERDLELSNAWRKP